MPTPVPSQVNINPTVGIPNTALSTSGNVSGAEFLDVVIVTQTLQGNWIRRWDYGAEPTGVSACPAINNTYCDVQATVTTLKEVRPLGVSGSPQQRQDIDYYSDSVSGGWGVSGAFWTSVAGVTVRKATPTDVSAYCTQTYPAVTNITTGNFDSSVDTSSNFNGEFLQNVVLPAVRECPEFISVIVDI